MRKIWFKRSDGQPYFVTPVIVKGKEFNNKNPIPMEWFKSGCLATPMDDTLRSIVIKLHTDGDKMIVWSYERENLREMLPSMEEIMQGDALVYPFTDHEPALKL